MSRVGKQPVKIPEKVKVSLQGGIMKAEGPLGKLELKIDELIEAKLADGKIEVTRKDDSQETRARHGLYRNLIRNLVEGVSTGYQKQLEIVGVGYRAEAKGNMLRMTLGFSHPVEFAIPDGIRIAVDKQTKLSISGADRVLVGETAARIRKLRSPEPYKGKGIKYVGEQIRRKVGKQAVSAGGGGGGGK